MQKQSYGPRRFPCRLLALALYACAPLSLDPTASPGLLRVSTFGRSVFELGAAQGPLLQINSTFNCGTLCPDQTPTEVLQLFKSKWFAGLFTSAGWAYDYATGA